jgi:hypothetical protein
MMQFFGQHSVAGEKSQPSFSSNPKHVPGEMIIWLEHGVEIDDFIGKIDPERLQLKRVLSNSLRIYLIEGFQISTERSRLAYIQDHPDVLLAQFNHYVQHRAVLDSIPGDPNFGQQWNLNNTGQTGGTPDADIDAPEAWDYAQGGLTACGDSIVLVLVDDGTDLTHEDLDIWVNKGEIPGNGRDDDRDGYVDNYLGWDAFTQNGASQPSTFHGTATAGIMAAKGNNNLGITGVAWNSKIIPLAGASGDEATVVASYAYALEQRRRFEASDGRNGAFVVAVNSSFGVNNGNPADFPIWCAMYDTLGSAGIVSVSSVANANLDLDQNNDMPTDCNSEFLITVTATNAINRRDNGVAWGQNQVDLAAPGRAVLGTAPNDRYATLSGSSAAAPQVTGAVALLLDRAGNRFMSLYDNQPDSAVLAIKSMILASVDPLPSLQDSTLSGGRLNLASAITEMDVYELALPACYAPYRIRISDVSDSSAQIRWKGPMADSFVISIVTAIDTQRLQVKDSSWLVQGLHPCERFAVRVQAWCGPDHSVWSSVVYSQTKGCCIPPQLVYFPEYVEDSLLLSWSPVFGVDSFLLRWQAGDSLWNREVIHDTLITLGDLPACRILRYQLASFCDTGLSVFGEMMEESTGRCGSCTEKTFCDAFTIDPGGDWIERFSLGPLDNLSGNNNGYEDFANSATLLERGKRYAIRLEPGFSGGSFDEYWRIWLDANQNGDFEDPGELIYDSGTLSDTVIVDTVIIPETAWDGIARLRVRIRFAAPATACGGIGFGETEDYCLAINGYTALDDQTSDKALIVTVFPNPASGAVNVESEAIIEQANVFDLHGRNMASYAPQTRKFSFKADEFAEGLYVLRMKISGASTSRLIQIKR